MIEKWPFACQKTMAAQSRIADVNVFSREGQLRVIRLFKQRFIDVHCYQQCQAEELL